MQIKFKKTRRTVIKIVFILVTVLFLALMVDSFISDLNVMLLISFIFQFVLFFGLYYFQAASYDDKKIMAQFGWPMINFEDIVSINSKFGNIVIKSDKHKITLDQKSIDEKSLNQFLEHLSQKSSQPIDKTILM